MKPFTNYQKAVHHLIHEIPKTSRRVFDDGAALKRNVRAMELLGNPQERHKAIHVAGTSGKGTICYLVDALLRAHTKRTGMTQSPHVYDIRERIQKNGQLISEKRFVEVLNHVLQTLRSGDVQTSYFETLIAMAYAEFGRSQLDYQIIETGFGGRLDATNVINRKDKACIINRIGLDHTDVLGETLPKIAAEKAGIIQAGNTVFALRQEPEVNAVFEARCASVGAELHWIEQTGNYQITNDTMAIRVCQYLADRDSWRFDEALAKTTLEHVFIPGRFEKRHFKDHLAIMDGAHNPQKLAAMAHRLRREDIAPATFVLGVGARKDIITCLKILKPVAQRIVATEYLTKQQDIPVTPLEKEVIAQYGQELGIEVSTANTPHEALLAASQFPEPIVITGSFYLLGQIDSSF